MCEFLLLPFVEFEIRFGTIGTNFDSCIDKRYFEKIVNTLETGIFENVVTKCTTEYIKDSLKLIDDSQIIMKENVKVNDIVLTNSPFDIRLSINQEFNLNSYLKSFNNQNAVVRIKNRKSFINKNYRYDLTIVNQKINGVSTTKHEIEFELLPNSETLRWDNGYINHFLESKIYDIVNIVEPLNRENFKIKVL
jgi:hypothetical protein